MNTLFEIWYSIQYKLFPWLEEELDPLSEKEEQFVSIVSLMDLNMHLKTYRWRGVGRQPENRTNISRLRFHQKWAEKPFTGDKRMVVGLCWESEG